MRAYGLQRRDHNEDDSRAVIDNGRATRFYASEGGAWLRGPREVVDTIAAASGLVARDCVDDLLRVIEHASEGALHAAATRAGLGPLPWGCTLCEGSRRGACVVHRENARGNGGAS